MDGCPSDEGQGGRGDGCRLLRHRGALSNDISNMCLEVRAVPQPWNSGCCEYRGKGTRP